MMPTIEEVDEDQVSLANFPSTDNEKIIAEVEIWYVGVGRTNNF